MQIDKSSVINFKEILKKNNLRVTKAREQTFNAIYSSKKPLSIQEILNKVEKAHFVSVYRSLDVLQRANIIKQVPQGFKNKYELSDSFKKHHHHITCEKCGHNLEVHDHRLEKLIEKITSERGLVSTKHHIEIYGICNSCSK